MSDSPPRRELARAAARLAVEARSPLPPLALMTDERLGDPLAAAALLPRGSLVVVRAREAAPRRRLAEAMLLLARRRGLIVLVAGDEVPGADGLHLPEARLGEALHWRARRPSWLLTAAVHSYAALGKAQRLGFDAVFLAPVFPTESHPGRRALGAVRANLLARASLLPVYALGGITARNAGRLYGFCGLAAVSSLDV
jgi:thiamine-phosphate pyrophosphorylase